MPEFHMSKPHPNPHHRDHQKNPGNLTGCSVETAHTHPTNPNPPKKGSQSQPPPKRLVVVPVGWCLRMLLRKEVIQPHLPVRLPCYDFVPIADPTFDHSPPYGLGHELRVLPTFVT
jgi:hypothetical protein